MAGKDNLIVALDVPTLAEAQQLADELRGEVGMFKVGLELYSREGLSLLSWFSKESLPVFFDGKFHDIPNTVGQASAAVVNHGVKMFNVHAAGGAKMISAAAEAAGKANGAKPILLAVTILTSMSQQVMNEEIGIAGQVDAQVKKLALLSQTAGADGVVASAEEASLIRQTCGKDFVIVTPGIRPIWAGHDDQKRVATPKEAIANGANYIVVGRPIVKAANRKDAARRIVEELESAV
ncbi:MAG: orotidine-5'-phosphate decarboxylase [Candidatus Obscuribacterales bacterium]|nr:orotidine-5'-phosphate decarboxylase [Candidatus Obscuribacterales bacterium]